jgi:hypothetical protein
LHAALIITTDFGLPAMPFFGILTLQACIQHSDKFGHVSESASAIAVKCKTINGMPQNLMWFSGSVSVTVYNLTRTDAMQPSQQQKCSYV